MSNTHDNIQQSLSLDSQSKPSVITHSAYGIRHNAQYDSQQLSQPPNQNFCPSVSFDGRSESGLVGYQVRNTQNQNGLPAPNDCYGSINAINSPGWGSYGVGMHTPETPVEQGRMLYEGEQPGFANPHQTYQFRFGNQYDYSPHIDSDNQHGIHMSNLLPPIVPPFDPRIMPMAYTAGNLAAFGIKRKRPGGRRPKEEEDETNVTDAERRRRMERRQKNKEAAARCRKRRLETLEALEQQLKKLKQQLVEKEEEIQNLQREKNDLEHQLRGHMCRMQPHKSGLAAAPVTPRRSESVLGFFGAKNPTLAEVAKGGAVDKPSIQSAVDRPSSLALNQQFPCLIRDVPVDTPNGDNMCCLPDVKTDAAISYFLKGLTGMTPSKDSP